MYCGENGMDNLGENLGSQSGVTKATRANEMRDKWVKSIKQS